ncbi:FAD-binding oxidoreductase [bacterium]|nr:FAD-binding oxidoreductase [bacterium]
MDAARDLENDLRRAVIGEVRFDPGTRALYATDASNYRQVPIGVVSPKSVDDVIAAAEIARKHGVPLLGRGGGTSLAGQCCNVAIVLDFSRHMRAILNLDPQQKMAEVEPGIVLDNVRNEAEKHRLTFGPDPASHNRCTIGGMIGNNSCGVHSVYAGKTAENIEELEILTYQGLRIRVGKTSEEMLQQKINGKGPEAEIYARLKSLRDRYADLIRQKYPKIPRRVSGYNLDQLLPENGFHVARALVGTESTCVLVLNAKLNLVHSPPYRKLVVLGFPDMATAGDHLIEILSHKPFALEGIDDWLVDAARKKGYLSENLALLPEGGGWLLVECGGKSIKEAEEHAESLKKGIASNGVSARTYDSLQQDHKVWRIRESALGLTAFVPGKPETWEGWEDAAVPPEKVGSYLREFRKLLDQFQYDAALYGHLGDGCVHTRINFDLFTTEGIKKLRSFVEAAADQVVSFGGSISGEHGDGQSKAELLPKMFGPELIEAFREFKSIWDPDGKMNPGKVVNPYRLDENLRLSPKYNPINVQTHFQYPDDQKSFARATLRCVGVGECRRMNGNTMCPSYRVTREEKHSTRGRAHLLFEMMQNDVLKDQWHDVNVKEALDLCLSCKGCKGDCPVRVDVATYKAEFLAHYYKGRLRPRSAYSMGLIYWWARLGSKIPGLVNFVMQSKLMKALAGISPNRRIPEFARQTFRKSFVKSESAEKRVILWPDTFNNFFFPDTLNSAVEVLRSAGFSVKIPDKILCCGRPLYDHGMLSTAKKLLREILENLKEDIRQGIPIVGIEPSCVAVFRDELLNLFPDNEDALKLSRQTFLLSEFLLMYDVPIPKLSKKAIVHMHCHHRAVMGVQSEEKILQKMGLDYQILDSGCCGMAGSFGFEKNHYQISVDIGDLVLLPAIRKASADEMIIADGFSCREQISQLTDRKAVHLADLLFQAYKRK